MYKFAICDDEVKYTLEIKRLLETFLTSKKINEFDIYIYTDGASLMNSKEKFDLIFLDIMLADMDGIHIAKSFLDQERKENIVFISNSEIGKVQGYRVNALRYITKPINEKEFFIDLESLLTKIMCDNQFVYEDFMDQKIYIRDILYIEVFGRYTFVHLHSGIKKIRKQLNAWENIVPDLYFAKCHKAFLINLMMVDEIDKNQIRLKNGEILSITRAYKEAFKNKFFVYLGNR